MNFYKYHGTGNDFIITEGDKPSDNAAIEALCNRRTGIGADGLIRITEDPTSDFRMVYYNADGKLGSMCGNGARCAVAFMHSQKKITNTCTFEAFDGVHSAQIEAGLIRLGMSDVSSVVEEGDHFELDTGSPHYVAFVEDVQSVDVKTRGAQIRNTAPYKAEGVNVNFVQAVGKGISMRTYERGVEDETLSCGTGVVAAALCFAIQNSNGGGKVAVQTKGGDLAVSFQKENGIFRNIELIGPAMFVYSGEIA